MADGACIALGWEGNFRRWEFCLGALHFPLGSKVLWEEREPPHENKLVSPSSACHVSPPGTVLPSAERILAEFPGFSKSRETFSEVSAAAIRMENLSRRQSNSAPVVKSLRSCDTKHSGSPHPPKPNWFTLSQMGGKEQGLR